MQLSPKCTHTQYTTFFFSKIISASPFFPRLFQRRLIKRGITVYFDGLVKRNGRFQILLDTSNNSWKSFYWHQARKKNPIKILREKKSFQIATCPGSFLGTIYRELKTPGTSVCETKHPGNAQEAQLNSESTWWRHQVPISIKTVIYGNLHDIGTEFWKTSLSFYFEMT